MAASRRVLFPLCAVLAILAAPALAQQQPPAKLIIIAPDQSAVITNYESSARCERAKDVIDADRRRRIAEQDANQKPGDTILRYGVMIYAICIPG